MTTSEAIATLEQLAPALAGRLELRLAAAADRGSRSGDWAGYAELELELRRRAHLPTWPGAPDGPGGFDVERVGELPDSIGNNPPPRPRRPVDDPADDEGDDEGDADADGGDEHDHAGRRRPAGAGRSDAELEARLSVLKGRLAARQAIR